MEHRVWLGDLGRRETAGQNGERSESHAAEWPAKVRDLLVLAVLGLFFGSQRVRGTVFQGWVLKQLGHNH